MDGSTCQKAFVKSIGAKIKIKSLHSEFKLAIKFFFNPEKIPKQAKCIKSVQICFVTI